MIRRLKYLFQRVGEIWEKRERRAVPQLKSSAEITVPIPMAFRRHTTQPHALLA